MATNFSAMLIILMVSTCNGHVDCDVKPTNTLSSSHFYGHPDTTMMNDMVTLQNTSRYECMQLCRRNASCLAFIYAVDIQSCSMFDRDSETGPELMQSAPGVWFYDMLNPRASQQSYVGKCADRNKCQNGASCINDCSYRGYYCACPEKYHGTFCENAFSHQPVSVQTITDDATRSSIAFKHLNVHYLVVGRCSDADASTTEVFKYVNTSGLYEVHQSLEGTSFAQGMESFEINGDRYLVVANAKSDDGTSTSATSYIYIFNRETELFEQHGGFSTEKAYSVSYLKTTANTHYLLIGNTAETFSIIYQWRQNETSFVELARLPTNKAKHGQLYIIDGIVYAVIANSESSEVEDVWAVVWKNDPNEPGKWSNIQDLPETNQRPYGVAIFENDGNTYLVIVNHEGCVQNTIVYVWNAINDEFEIHQRIPIEHCPVQAEVFHVGGHIFMAVATGQQSSSDTSSANYDTMSPIFKLEGSMFVKYWELPARWSERFYFFERDGEYFLAQTNNYNDDDVNQQATHFNILKWI